MGLSCLLTLSNAYAIDGEALFDKYDCHVCHNSTGKRKVGPNFAMVAERYANDAKASERLVKKLRNGGSGSWGGMPMPAIPSKATDAEVKTLIMQVLATKY